jgi:hypothetical protein
MTFSNETEKIKAEIKVLEAKLSFLEELERTKSPVEEAFKDWMGVYPPTGPSVDGIDDIRWRAFQMGYNAAYEEKVSEWQPTPQTPEETAQSLKEAFVEAQKTEKWKEIEKLIDEEDNDKNFKNSLDLIKEWGEKNKPPTLKELLWEWWEDIFTVDSDLDADASIDDLVDKIDKQFIPPSSDRNTYEWEKCLKIMRDKLR